MPRLLVALSSASFGGAEMYALAMAAGAAKAGWTVELAAPALPGLAALRERAAALALPVRDAALHEPFVARPAGASPGAWWSWLASRWPVREPAVAWRTARLLAATRPDVVHVNAHFGTRGALPALVAGTLGYPAVVVFQLAEGHATAGPRLRWLFRRGVALGAHWIAVTSADQASLVRTMGVPADRVHLVHNSVDLERPPVSPERRRELRRQLSAAEDDRVLLTVGRLSGQKGYAVLLEALRAVVRRAPRVRAWWVGDGELREPLAAALAGDPELAARVQLLGFRADVPDLLGAADAFVLPSVYEGLPFSLLEAMAAGLPCISTTIPGVQEVAVPDRDALLVPPGEAAPLAAAIERLLADPELAVRLAAAGRKRAGDFDRRAMIAKTLEVYERALRPAAAR